MVSFWKTQCGNVIIAAFYFVLSLVNLFLENDFACLFSLISAFAWLLTAVSCHNHDCIKKLEERVEALENRAITDIDKVQDITTLK